MQLSSYAVAQYNTITLFWVVYITFQFNLEVYLDFRKAARVYFGFNF